MWLNHGVKGQPSVLPQTTAHESHSDYQLPFCQQGRASWKRHDCGKHYGAAKAEQSWRIFFLLLVLSGA